MSASKIVCLVAIALILVVAFYKCPKKEGFRVAPPAVPPAAFNGMISDENVPQGQDYSPGNIMTLNGSTFRGGTGFADMVASPSLPVQKQQAMGQVMSPSEMMPQGSMDAQGIRYNADGSIPNEGNVAYVNLARNKLQADCVTATFNLNGGHIRPVNSVHADFSGRIHYIPNSLISGSEYDRAQVRADKADGVFDEYTKRLEVAFV